MLRFILCWYSQEYTAALFRRHIAAKPNSALADQPRGKKKWVHGISEMVRLPSHGIKGWFEIQVPYW